MVLTGETLAATCTDEWIAFCFICIVAVFIGGFGFHDKAFASIVSCGNVNHTSFVAVICVVSCTCI